MLCHSLPVFTVFISKPILSDMSIATPLSRDLKKKKKVISFLLFFFFLKISLSTYDYSWLDFQTLGTLQVRSTNNFYICSC